MFVWETHSEFNRTKIYPIICVFLQEPTEICFIVNLSTLQCFYFLSSSLIYLTNGLPT